MDSQIFDELLGEFLLEAEERIGRVEDLMLQLDAGAEADPRSALVEVKRELHTLKGNAGMMGLDELQRVSHELEDRAAELDPEAPAVVPILAGLDRCRALLRPLAAGRGGGEPSLETSLRVPAARLERLTDLLAEQIAVRLRVEDRLAALEAELGGAHGEAREALRGSWREYRRLLDEVHREVLALRMVPLASVFRGLRRLAHDEAERSGKLIRVESRGEETPLDRSLVEAAAEALGHLVRNAVAHGIEAPGERRRRGKDETGTLLLRAAIGSDRVAIEVIDDGAGIDRAALAAAAGRAGIAGAESAELDALLFLPGVSTRSTARLEAGRGVGLTAVREAARSFGGDVEIVSEEGVGTRFTLSLPTSVATREVLLVEASGERYALPVAAVVETVAASAFAAEEGVWRGRPLERIDLESLLTRSGRRAERRRFVAIVEVEGRRRGLEVDGFGGLEELVVQGVDPLAARPGVAGAAVLADGAPVLVLDPYQLVHEAEHGGAAG